MIILLINTTEALYFFMNAVKKRNKILTNSVHGELSGEVPGRGAGAGGKGRRGGGRARDVRHQ